MDYEYYDNYINKETRVRRDITPIFEHPKVFSNLLEDLFEPFKDSDINKIIGLDALGFIIGSALSQKHQISFVPIRKGGKLPSDEIIKSTFVDYTSTTKSFEINTNSINKKDRILIVDDCIETGAQMISAIKLIEKLEGTIVGISVICSYKNSKTRELFDKYNCNTLGTISKINFENE